MGRDSFSGIKAMRGFLTLAIAGLAMADLQSDIAKMSSLVISLDGVVAEWSRERGLQGALAIQEGYAPVAHAASSLSAAVNGSPPKFPVNEVGNLVHGFSSMAAALQKLLTDLSSKASDAHSVGVSAIVANDLKELPALINNIVEGVYTRIPAAAPCPQIVSVSQLGATISSALGHIGTVYGVPTLAAEFPAAPRCGH